jgi:hypothetical protein
MDRLSPSQPHVRLMALALGAALLLSQSGCQIIIGTMLMLGGRSTQDCDFKAKTGEKLAGKEKKVVVLCAVPDSAREEYGGLDVDIITDISRGLQESGVKVADSQKVASWMDKNGVGMSDVQLVEVAREFKSNYIILVHFDQFSFRETNSPNMFRGRARGNVSVTRIEKSNGTEYPRRIYNTVFGSTYPSNQPIPDTDRHAATFRLEFVQRVGTEVGRLFHDYLPEDAFSG